MQTAAACLIPADQLTDAFREWSRTMKHCYVSMPYGEALHDVYVAIEREVKENLNGQWSCAKADDKPGSGMASEKVVSALLNANLVIAVVADPREANTINPNVMYELGIAHSFRKTTIVVADIRNALPFNIQSVETIQLDFWNPNLTSDLRRALQRSLRNTQVLDDLARRRIPRNPITAQLGETRIFIEDLPWLWGYSDVLKREREAATVWEITRDLYWPTESLFLESLKEAIRKRRKHYFMVENEEGVLRKIGRIKKLLHQDFTKDEISELLHFVAIDRNYFVLWPIAVVLFDADLATRMGGIICEPMQNQIGDDYYDRRIRDLLVQRSSPGDLDGFQKDLDDMDWTDRRREGTFDIALDPRVVGELATSFVKIWNGEILEEAHSKSSDERTTLLNTWLIGE